MFVRVRATGTLQHTSQQVVLVSEGDNTRFTLLSPVVPMKGQAAEFNLDARQLQPALLKKLLDAEAEHMVATIEGPLFMPERGTALSLVVEQSSFAEPKKRSIIYQKQ